MLTVGPSTIQHYIAINNNDTRDNTNITDEREDERSSIGGIVAGVVVSLLVVAVVIAAIILAGVWLWRRYVINSHLFMCMWFGRCNITILM